MLCMHAKPGSAGDHYELLKNCGLRPTYVRVAIVEVLEKAADPYMTADQIYLELSRQHYSMRLRSIYRCLNSLKHKGIVACKWDSTQSKNKYLIATRKPAISNCRFHCRCCGYSIEVSDINLYDSLQLHAKLINFLPFPEILRVESLCVQCASFSGIHV